MEPYDARPVPGPVASPPGGPQVADPTARPPVPRRRLSLPVDHDSWPGQAVPPVRPEPDGEQPEGEVARDAGPGQPDPRIGQAARSGTLLAFTVALVGLTAVWPVVAVAVFVLACWVARFTDRSMTSLVVRRHAGGRRRSDVPVAVAASPWHLLSAALGTVVALLLPAAVALATTFSAALAVVGLTGGDPHPDTSAPLAAGAFLGILTAWWGPGGASLRRGARSLVRGGVRGRSTSEILVTALLLAGAGLGVWAWLRGGMPDWSPWTADQLPFASLRHR
jgi:hypothetical protein